MWKRLAVIFAALAIGACDGYDPPEEAEPFDTIAPAPHDSAPPAVDFPSENEGLL